ncbi:MAG: hypothetical protein C4576_19380 [Desulfobacteraceae bacterium]|nr:MAG: hypothetical protein C4576_19380 [Desulfobacteraceae bacterium]
MTEDRDRELLLETIQGFEKVPQAEKALVSLEAEAAKTYDRMVEGEDLEGLRRLHKVCSDLKPSFEKSWAYGVVLDAIKDRIEDELMVLKRKAA